ncbi:MAG TPA: N-acetylglucosamine-6-phosphate deacetylase [Xanthobacteraceae bacterium]|jgi:N-acetylglucosamine-6-phosphate deacetylase|nr:N-acetylglucosamine-6-phosphate deacetylase [Xanthobacteraceae bacterium]
MSDISHAVAARTLFDGVNLRENVAVLIRGEQIVGISNRDEISSSVPVEELPDSVWLAPGFIDIQVNGGGDLLFNDAPTAETIQAIAQAHRRFGTTALLPTLISDSPDKTPKALAAVEQAAAGNPSILGIHLEGPFLSPEKPGVHDPHALRRPTKEDIALITAKRKSATLVTLAPEQVGEGVVAALVDAGIHVALGHSMATYAQTVAAMRQGLTGFTHLFNAMPPLQSREPGPIAAALESPDAWYGLIVDGLHVAPAMLRLALRGAGHPILVTDAMPPVGGTRQSFKLNGEDILVRDGRCATRQGTLAGAYLDMATAVRNCVQLLDLPLTNALRFASTHPAQFLGLGHALGRLMPGYRADMVALDPASIKVVQTWVAGAAA